MRSDLHGCVPCTRGNGATPVQTALKRAWGGQRPHSHCIRWPPSYRFYPSSFTRCLTTLRQRGVETPGVLPVLFTETLTDELPLHQTESRLIRSTEQWP